MEVQRRSQHRTRRWANGLGTTAEVFVSPQSNAEFTWRLSIASVAENGPGNRSPSYISRS